VARRVLSTSFLAVPPVTIALLKLDIVLVFSVVLQAIELAGQGLRCGRVMNPPSRLYEMRGGERNQIVAGYATTRGQGMAVSNLRILDGHGGKAVDGPAWSNLL
jgi:hypothetical protein